VTACVSNRLEVSYHDAPLVYQFDANEKALKEIWQGKTKIVLDGCDAFTFSMFQRNPVEGSYDQYPATLDVNTAKIVQVSWICSRHLINNLINSESIQSAKIVI